MKKKNRIFCLICLIPLLFCCGCPSLLNGRIEYEIVYPSGNVRGEHSYTPVTIEQTTYQLDCRSEVVKEGSRFLGIGREYADYLQILDEKGNLLYEYEDVGNDTLWGIGTEDGTAWISSEDWITSHTNGYRSHNLQGSVLLRVDLSNGEILFQQEIGEYELYLMTKGTRCYFYDCGEESEEKLFGLITTEQENARIFYRDIENWDEKVTVYTFDYALYPDGEEMSGLRFSLEREDEIKVSSMERTSMGELILDRLVYVISLDF